MIIGVIAATVVFVTAVIAATLSKLAFSAKTVGERIAMNMMYFFFLLAVCIVLCNYLGLDIGSGSVIATITVVAGFIAIIQSPLQDVMAFTLIYLRRMYNVGDILIVGEHMGHVKSMTMTTVTIENAMTNMRIELPHRMVFMNFTRI